MNKVLVILIAVLGVFALITQVAKVYISNTTSIEGLAATKIQNEIDEYSEKNLVLRDKVLSFASYHAIASRAAELGLVSTKDIVSVYYPVKVALVK